MMAELTNAALSTLSESRPAADEVEEGSSIMCSVMYAAVWYRGDGGNGE